MNLWVRDGDEDIDVYYDGTGTVAFSITSLHPAVIYDLSVEMSLEAALSWARELVETLESHTKKGSDNP